MLSLCHEARPFLGCLFELGDVFYSGGNLEAAIPYYERILDLDNRDGTGARYYLVHAYLNLERFDDAKKLLDTYPEDAGIGFVAARLLLSYFRDGNSIKSRELLKEAQKEYPHLIKVLLKRDPFIIPKSDLIAVGSVDEAKDYFFNHGEI